MKDIEWDSYQLSYFRKGEFYIINNSDFLAEDFIKQYSSNMAWNRHKYWWVDKGRFLYSNTAPIIFTQSVSLTNMRKDFKVYVQSENIPYKYLYKILEEKLKTNQIIVTGNTGEAITELSSLHGAQYKQIASLDCDGWIVTEHSMVLLAKQNGIKVRLYQN